MEPLKVGHDTKWNGLGVVAPFVRIKGHKYYVTGTRTEGDETIHTLQSDRTGEVREYTHDVVVKAMDRTFDKIVKTEPSRQNRQDTLF